MKTPPNAVYVLVQYTDGIPSPLISVGGGKAALRCYTNEKRARGAAQKAGVDCVKVSFPTRQAHPDAATLFNIRGELAVKWQPVSRLEL